MPRQIPVHTRRVRSPLENVLLLILALAVAMVLWNVLGALAGLALFALVVYLIYRLLQHYI